MKLLDENSLRTISEAISASPCPICGGKHRVNITTDGSRTFAGSSAHWLVDDARNKVCVEIEAGACDGFAERLCRFLHGKLIGGGFPLP